MRLRLPLILIALACGCRTPAKAPSSEVLSVTPEDAGESGGYFVTLDARSTDRDAVFLYDKLVDAVNAQAKKRAAEAGNLSGYLEEYEQTGYTSLAAGDNEIECDRDKCLVKLEGRVIKSGEPGKPSLAGELMAGLAESGVAPLVTGGGEGIVKTYVVETKAGKGVRCRQHGFGLGAAYDCRFDLDVKRAAKTADMNPATRGKLASCALSPGVVRSAEQARTQIEGGALLNLTASPGGKPVGFMRYARQGGRAELIDIYLCGDVSHDYFQLDGPARDPRSWTGAVEPARGDDAELQLKTTTASGGAKYAQAFVVEMKIMPPGGGEGRPGELYGEDKFYVSFPRSWLK